MPGYACRSFGMAMVVYAPGSRLGVHTCHNCMGMVGVHTRHISLGMIGCAYM